MDFGQLMLFCCFIPSLILVVVGFFIVRNVRLFLSKLGDFSAPDTSELHEQYTALKQQFPQESQDKLITRIINKYAMRQGIVGALTSVGGFVVLPFGLAIDMLYSAKSNSALSYFIAQTYGIEEKEKTLNINQLFVLSQRKISADELVMWQEQFAGVAFRQFLQSLLQKSLAKLIPGVGAVIGFLVDYLSAQFFGRLAKEYYSRNIGELIEGGSSVLFDSLSSEKRSQVWDGFKERSMSLLGSNVGNISNIIPKLQAGNYDPTEDKITQLHKLMELKEKGVLDEAQFNTMKEALLAGLAEEMDEVEQEVLTDDTNDSDNLPPSASTNMP